ncbi:MAG: ABC transporter permease, partial [Owenweeksia sp.]
MFKEFFVREIRGALGRPMVYIFFLIYTLLVFGAVASDNVIIGSAIGNVYKNAPDTVTTFVTVLSLFGLLFAAAFCNNAALRDYSNQFHEILFSTPLRKSGYFFGRFSGAFLLSTLPLLGIYLGVILATILAPAFGWLDADRLGPIPWEAMADTYLVFVLPNMLFGGAIIFWLAHRFRSTTISFVSVAVIIMAYLISGTLLSDVDNETLAALTDPFGIRTYSVHSKYFTPIEKNTISPSYTGLILQNRLIWISVSLLVTLVSYLTFSVRERRAFRLKKVREESEVKYVPVIEVKEKVNTVFNLKTSYLQFFSFFTTGLSSMLKSIVFRILIIICLLIVVSEMVAGFEHFGLQSYPVTY